MDGETEFESTYLESIVSGWAVANGETPADEVVLDVDDDQAAHRTDDLEKKRVVASWIRTRVEAVRVDRLPNRIGTKFRYCIQHGSGEYVE